MPSSATLYHGGVIHPAEPGHPAPEAVAVRNGRIAAVGALPRCRAALGSHFDTVDLNGGAMLPGFIDTHLHPTAMILFALSADLTGVVSMAELGDRLRAMAEKDASAGWVTGLQFDDQVLTPPRMPDRRDLDAICSDRPVFLLSRDGHTVMANTKAMAAAGIGADTPDPPGGRIDREAGGRPLGIFRETAAQILLDAVPLPEMQALVDAAATVFARLAASGITSAGVVLQTDAEGISGEKGIFDVPLMELVDDVVPIGLYAILAGADMAKVESGRRSALHRPNREPRRRVNGYKLWADGTFASSTAYLTAPFADAPDRNGFLLHEPDAMYRRMRRAHNAGMQIAIHTIGDAGTRICIDLYDRLLREHPRPDHRHRLEHASLGSPELIADMARLGLVVCTQPMFIHSEKDWLHRRLGRQRARWVYPFRAMRDAGVRLAGASDAPVERLDVLHAIQCCVTRDGFEPHQCLTVDEAIDMFTIDAAYAQFEEPVAGSIAPGKRADMVILDRHPAQVPPESIRNLCIQKTICNGRIIYPPPA